MISSPVEWQQLKNGSPTARLWHGVHAEPTFSIKPPLYRYGGCSLLWETRRRGCSFTLGTFSSRVFDFTAAGSAARVEEHQGEHPWGP